MAKWGIKSTLKNTLELGRVPPKEINLEGETLPQGWDSGEDMFETHQMTKFPGLLQATAGVQLTTQDC